MEFKNCNPALELLLEQFEKAVDGFLIRRTIDKHGDDRYYWEYDDKQGNEEIEPGNWFETKGECFLDFLSRIDGFHLRR